MNKQTMVNFADIVKLACAIVPSVMVLLAMRDSGFKAGSEKWIDEIY
jgi:hypothetical protein